MADSNLNDSREMYHTGKFPDQEQGTPALQSKMDPVPDCGEESYKGHNRLEGRNALITGGDSGIGRAAAIAYAREGANVAVHFLPGEEEDANEVKELIEKEGRKALLLPYDLREDKAASEIVDKTVEEFGALDILVLNAAQQIAQTELKDISIKQVEDTFKVNIISMFETVKAAEKHLEPGSAIVMTSSVNNFDPSPAMMDYAATNGAVGNLTVSLSKYFSEKGVRVNGVAPGPIWTPLQMDNGQPEGKIPEFGQGVPLGRAGQPVELASTYVLLASDEGSYITGQIFGITGGMPTDL